MLIEVLVRGKHLRAARTGMTDFWGVLPKGVMDGLCPIQSDPYGPVLPTARLPWHGFCKYPVRGFSRCSRFTKQEVGS